MTRLTSRTGIFLLLAMITISALTSCGGGGGGGSTSTPPPTAQPPAIPTAVSLIPTSTSLTIVWNPVLTATSYDVFRSLVSGASYSVVALGVPTTSFDDATVSPGVTYYYVVQAKNSGGTSPRSSEVSGGTLPPQAPSVVSALSSNASVTVIWSAVPKAASYNVLRSTVSGTSYAPVATSIAVLSYADSSVVSGTTYYYVVQTVNAAGTSAYSGEVSATPQPSGSSLAQVHGTIQYEDKEYNIFGFTGAMPLKPVRYASVDLMLQGGISPVLSTRTSATGFYSFQISSNLGNVHYVRVNSDASSPYGKVNINTLSKQLYGVRSADFTPVANMELEIGLTVLTANPAGGAFNILDVYTAGSAFLNSLSLASVPTVTVFWPSATGSSGTYYCNALFAGDCAQGAGIYVLSEPFNAGGYDTDEYDDDVLWHEFGHFATDVYSMDDSPAGPHFFTSNDADLRLSWSEGWSDFFQASVKSWLNDTAPGLLSLSTASAPLSQYVDTATLPRSYYISLNMASPESNATETFCVSDECMYSSNEVAVANVLWNLMTSPTPTFGMPQIWSVFSSLPTSTVTATPVNLESFWDEWKHQKGTSFEIERPDHEAIYGDRRIFYREDAADSTGGAGGDDTQGAAAIVSVPSETQRTLFRKAGTGDVDFFAFNGTIGAVYTVSTTSRDTLKNGADTVITVYRSDGVTVVSPQSGTNPNDTYDAASYATCDDLGNNCPVNGDLYSTAGSWVGPAPLSSRVIFTAPATEPYVIRVETTPKPSRPLSAGRYGTYTLTVTSP